MRPARTSSSSCFRVAEISRTSTFKVRVAAHPLELLFLQDAEELGLHRRSEVRHFVEEQAPPVRQFKTPLPILDGAGEGPLLVAEQFASP